MTDSEFPSRGVRVRWLAGGVVELATADRALLYVDAWLWSNGGWDRFGVTRPPGVSDAAAFARYVQQRDAAVVAFLVTHDHRDHIEDLYEALQALDSAGVEVRVVMQSDLARAGLVGAFSDAGLDPASLIVTGGAGINIGGRTTVGPATVTAVPAVHSTLAGHPAIGYIVEVAGTTLYCSGDTDVFGDMRLIGQRYRPDSALLCVGGGPFTMDAEGAALAAELLGVREVVPIHYGHNPMVAGPDAGQRFADEIAKRDLDVRAHVLRPGETVELRVGA